MIPKVLLISLSIAVSALACSSPDWAGGRANVGGVVETGMTEAKSVSLGDAVQVGSKVSGIAAGLEHVSTAGFGRHASIVLYADGNFSRRVTYRYANRSIDPLVPSSDPLIVVDTSERNPLTLKWEHQVLEYSVSFSPRIFASFHGGDDFLVGGYSNYGDVVVEHWRIAPRDGAYYCSRSYPGTAVGMAAVESTNTVGIKGQYVSVNDRKGQMRIARDELYRGTILNTLAFIEGDPDGRFFVAGSNGDGRLLRFDLQERSPAVPTVLFTGQTLPFVTVVDEIRSVKHTVSGRGLQLTDHETSDTLFLWDADNDGTFDEFEAVSGADLETSHSYWDFLDL